jgi:5-methylcytosine-specific restriction endonuclease McrA
MKRYKATAVVQWEFELGENEQNPFRFAHEQILKMLTGYASVRIAKVDKCKQKDQSNTVLGEFLPEDVLPFVTSSEEKREYRVGKKQYLVRMNSHRYFVFRSSRRCVACGLEGVKMLLEQHPNDRSPHFNLYALEDGQLVLMTKDHIHAKSCGGEDRHSNYQTMCSICNNLKASSNLTIDGIRQLRDLYNQNKNRLSKKKLAILISDAREQLETPWPIESNGNNHKNSVVIQSDVSVLRNPLGELVGVPLYESVDAIKDHGLTHVASIKKGTVATFLHRDGEKLIFPFNDTSFTLYRGLAK